jgi:serine protease SohB
MRVFGTHDPQAPVLEETAMEFFAEYGMFLVKILTLAIATVVVAAALINLIRSQRTDPGQPGALEVRHLNADFEQAALAIRSAMLPAKALKVARKELKARRKSGPDESRRRIFVIDFQGDLRATALTSLRQEISAILAVARKDDEVLVRLESGGGQVHAYGLAAAQLKRIRDREIRLTVAIDKIAASGGYLMACVADRILAAPFAIVGSIGVIAQLPNFNRWLKSHDVDFEQFTAGEYKRTVTLFGENTDAGRDKFQQEIEEVHGLFKDFVKTHRSTVDLDQISTGEYWYGTRAVDQGLVDQLVTSDDYLMKSAEEAEMFQVHHVSRKPLLTRLIHQGSDGLARVLERN